MKQDAERPFSLSSEEQRLLQDTRFFEVKAAVSQKVKIVLQQLHRDLSQNIPDYEIFSPEGFDLSTHQFVKGEHLMDFPYRYLDYPKHFKNKEMLTFRTLFWWGHFFVFSIILGGKNLGRYKENFLIHYEVLADKGLFLLMTDQPWEWRRGSDFVLEIRADNQSQVREVLQERPFLKLHRYLDFDNPELKAGRLSSELLSCFKIMWLLVEKPHPQEA